MEPWELVRSLCLDPSLKFITPIHTQSSKSRTTWDQAVSCVTHPSALRRRDPTQGKASCISLIPAARSTPSNIESLIANVGNLEKKLKQVYNSVPWNPFLLTLSMAAFMNCLRKDLKLCAVFVVTMNALCEVERQCHDAVVYTPKLQWLAI